MMRFGMFGSVALLVNDIFLFTNGFIMDADWRLVAPLLVLILELVPICVWNRILRWLYNHFAGAVTIDVLLSAYYLIPGTVPEKNVSAGYVYSGVRFLFAIIIPLLVQQITCKKIPTDSYLGTMRAELGILPISHSPSSQQPLRAGSGREDRFTEVLANPESKQTIAPVPRNTDGTVPTHSNGNRTVALRVDQMRSDSFGSFESFDSAELHTALQESKSEMMIIFAELPTDLLDEKGRVQECSICTELMEKGCCVGILTCAHQYHGQCIQDWKSTQGRKGLEFLCPICNTMDV